MPNIKSAKKRVKTDAKKKVANKNNASSMRTAIKKVRAEIKNENKEHTQKFTFPVAYPSDGFLVSRLQDERQCQRRGLWEIQ